MPVETNTPSEDSPKQVAFYTAVVEAWVETRMEKDKTLLGLATGGIGLLATLLTTVGPTSKHQLWLYGFAALSFISTIITAVWIFDRNSQHLEDVVLRGVRSDDSLLVKFDLVVFLSFILGVVATGVIAIWSGFAKVP